MSFLSGTRKASIVFASFALCASPGVASATAVSSQSQTISPMVALSIFGSQASAAALCGLSAGTAASAAATSQAPAGGCVLPVVDALPLPPVAEAAPLPTPASYGITPVLLGLAGVATVFALFLGDDDDNDFEPPPVSVN